MQLNFRKDLVIFGISLAVVFIFVGLVEKRERKNEHRIQVSLGSKVSLFDVALKKSGYSMEGGPFFGVVRLDPNKCYSKDGIRVCYNQEYVTISYPIEYSTTEAGSIEVHESVVVVKDLLTALELDFNDLGIGRSDK